jgi:FkbM family methyltransferase
MLARRLGGCFSGPSPSRTHSSQPNSGYASRVTLNEVRHILTARLLRTLSALALIGWLYLAAFYLWPPAGATLLVAAGRGPRQDPLGAVQGFYHHYKGLGFRNELSQTSTVLQRDSEGFQLVQTPLGKYWEPVVDGSGVVAQLAELRAKYDRRDKVGVQPGDVVLDCGANVGTHTKAALDAGASIVVAIEPAPASVLCLRRNLAREIAAGRVIVREEGVWDRQEVRRLRLHSRAAENSFVRSEGAEEGPLVPLTTIDNLVTELRLGRVDFIKMDIEGAERRALQGAAATIARFRPRMEISVDHLPDDPEQVPAVVKAAWSGYRMKYLLCYPVRPWRVDPAVIYFY